MVIPPKFERHQFDKANRSKIEGDDCVAIARGLGYAVVRNTRAEFRGPRDYHFSFPVDLFDALQEAIRAANLRTATVPAGVLVGYCISIERRGVDENLFRSTIPQEGVPAKAALVFTDSEVKAFFDGVHEREFDNDGDYVAHTVECGIDCSVPNHVVLVAA
jgi:hypothetical protein